MQRCASTRCCFRRGTSCSAPRSPPPAGFTEPAVEATTHSPIGTDQSADRARVCMCVCVCVRCCFASQLACMLDGVRYPDTASWSVADWIDELRITRNHHQHSNNCGVKPSVLRDTVRLVTGCIAALSRLKGLPPADAQALSKLVRACCM